MRYDAPCEQVRRLIIREESRRFDTDLASSDTSMAFPLPSDPTLERTAVDLWVSAYDSDNVLLARQFVNWVRDRHTCWYAPGTEPLMSVEPTSGDCDGEVTFRGSRFPTDVRVEIAIIPYGTDSPGGFVGTSTVAPDGTFALTTRLPTGACWIATRAPQGAVYLAAYNADQPKLDAPSLPLGTHGRAARSGAFRGGSGYRHRSLGRWRVVALVGRLRRSTGRRGRRCWRS